MAENTSQLNFSFGAVELRNKYKLKVAFASSIFNLLNVPFFDSSKGYDTTISQNGTGDIKAGKGFLSPIFPNDIVYFLRPLVEGMAGSGIYAKDFYLSFDGLPFDGYKFQGIEVYFRYSKINSLPIEVKLAYKVIDNKTIVLDISNYDSWVSDSGNLINDFNSFLVIKDAKKSSLFYDYKLKLNDVSIYAPARVVNGLDINYLDDKGVLFLNNVVDLANFETQPSTISIPYTAINDLESGNCGYLLEKIGGQ